MSTTVLCDTSVIMEVYKGTEKKGKIISYLKGKSIFISELTLFEIYRKYLSEKPQVADEMLDETIVHADKIIETKRDILLRAAEFSVKYKLSMADAIILACAESEKAELFTLDKDFQNKGIIEVTLKIG